MSESRPKPELSTELLLASLVEGAADYAIFLLDLDGFVTTWNAGAQRIEGYRAEEIIGRHFSCFYTREDRERGEPERHLAKARAAWRHSEEGWRVRRDGSRFWAHATLTALRDEAGLPIGYSKITRDLTAQRQAEQRFRATIESAPTAMVMVDAQGRIVLINAATEKLFGYERRELLQSPVEVLLPERFRARHPQQRASFFARPAARPMGAGRDLFGLRRDGSEVPIEIGLSPVETDEGMFVLSAIVEITERKRLEEAQRKHHLELEERVEQRTAELAIARDAAQAANRAKTQFLANMSHEIRTPLNAVVGLSEILLRGELSETQRDYLQTVVDSAEALMDIINEVLDFSKIEAGKLSLENVLFELPELIHNTLRPLEIRAEGKGLALTCWVDPGLSRERIGDPVRLSQVITNLVNNAIKFTARGEVAVRVEPDGVRGRDRLRFSVRDSGIGIDPESLDRMFEPFEQADSSTTRRHGGTGLGLSICRQLVELMGGEISATSTRAAGSTFVFSVPLAASADCEAALVSGKERTRALPAISDAASPPQRILLVEDSIPNQKVARALLQGHALSVASNGREALLALADREFDLVLMDVQMPEMDGFEATAAIRAAEAPTGRRVPIIAMTAHALPGDREKCLAAGMDDYVVKPIRRDDLFRALARVRELARAR
jgi:PAS domain S-box-containing protein